MLLWCLASGLLLLAFVMLTSDPAFTGGRGLSPRHERAILRHVCGVLQEIEQTFEAGLVPDEARWKRLFTLPPPWGELSVSSIEELRSRGGAVLPTLRRLRKFAFDHAGLLAEAQARSAQALVQALGCSALVPLTGVALYWILPGVDQHRILWAGACLGALALSGVGSWWLLGIAERARWGGLKGSRRAWVLVSHCAGERFLSLVRTGEPPDAAWASALDLVSREAPDLRAFWSGSVWGPGNLGTGDSVRASASGSHSPGLFIHFGEEVCRAIQASLVEGRTCLERVERLLAALRADFGAVTEKELNLLGTRALQPLFICIAPSLVGLLCTGLWLSWTEAYVF